MQTCAILRLLALTQVKFAGGPLFQQHPRSRLCVCVNLRRQRAVERSAVDVSRLRALTPSRAHERCAQITRGSYVYTAHGHCAQRARGNYVHRAHKHCAHRAQCTTRLPLSASHSALLLIRAVSCAFVSVARANVSLAVDRSLIGDSSPSLRGWYNRRPRRHLYPKVAEKLAPGITVSLCGRVFRSQQHNSLEFTGGAAQPAPTNVT